jgi:hypothetical protein
LGEEYISFSSSLFSFRLYVLFQKISTFFIICCIRTVKTQQLCSDGAYTTY